MPDHTDSEFCKFANKTHIANLIAAFVIIAGVTFVFVNVLMGSTVQAPEMLTLIVGAGIGYLFAKKVS